MSQATQAQTFKVVPVTGAIGANVYGLDLSKPISTEQAREVRQAVLRYHVLFFREQNRIDPGQHLALGRQFGELHHHPCIPHLAGYPGIMVIKADKDTKTHFGPSWHSDVSCEEDPPMGTILQIHTPPPFGGDTLFASMNAVYERLSPTMRRFLETLEADHELWQDRIYNKDGTVSDAKEPLRARHPVIRTHPETGKQGLFVNRIFTKRIHGLSPGESHNLLEFLLRQVEDPYVQVRLTWQKNDVAFWDNRSTQHLAIWDYFPHERIGHRVTILGDKPFFRPG